MIFKRRRTADPYVRRAEELLRESGWARVSGEGAASIWTRADGTAWMWLEEGVTEMALLVAPDPVEEPRWLI
jgi:hypothetical protein